MSKRDKIIDVLEKLQALEDSLEDAAVLGRYHDDNGNPSLMKPEEIKAMKELRKRLAYDLRKVESNDAEGWKREVER